MFVLTILDTRYNSSKTQIIHSYISILIKSCRYITILKYIHWTSNDMFHFCVWLCSYIASQRSNEMLRLTIRTLNTCPLEKASCNVSFVSLYFQIILQGGLQSAEHLNGPIFSPSLIVNLPLSRLGSGLIDSISGLSINMSSTLKNFLIKLHNMFHP